MRAAPVGEVSLVHTHALSHEACPLDPLVRTGGMHAVNKPLL